MRGDDDDEEEEEVWVCREQENHADDIPGKLKVTRGWETGRVGKDQLRFSVLID